MNLLSRCSFWLIAADGDCSPRMHPGASSGSRRSASCFLLSASSAAATADCRDKVRVRPQRWPARAALPEPLTQQTRGPALDGLDPPVDAELRVHVHQQTHEVRHHFDLDQLSTSLPAHVADNRLETNIRAFHEHLPPILWTPNDVVLADKRASPRGAHPDR
jgi:hypothetical protein